jgi:aromatic ring-opening dioxygenase LigB subunit
LVTSTPFFSAHDATAIYERFFSESTAIVLPARSFAVLIAEAFATAIPALGVVLENEPAPSPARCYRFGQVIRDAVAGCADIGRVAIYASGGLSHFTAGYPWQHYSGPYGHGDIDEDFDRAILGLLAAGRGSDLARLSSGDLLDHGEVELRSWIVALGAIGDVKPTLLTYAPLFRAIMGMGVASWNAGYVKG